LSAPAYFTKFSRIGASSPAVPSVAEVVTNLLTEATRMAANANHRDGFMLPPWKMQTTPPI